MTLDFSATTYNQNARWYRRPESATAIAERFRFNIEQLSDIHSTTAWSIVRKRNGHPFATPYTLACSELASVVETSRPIEDDGSIDPREGYVLRAFTRQEPAFSLGGFVGRDFPSPNLNTWNFATPIGYWPDLSLMTYPLFRSITLATIASWQPIYCTTRVSTLRPLIIEKSWYDLSWITYVHPSLVHRVTPPDIPVVEPTPDGGLLLAATTDTFVTENPAHLDAARRIAVATRHLNDVMPPL